MGGIWEINFSLPPRGGRGRQVPDGAVDEAGVRPWATAECQQLVEQGDGGVGADCCRGPQRVLPAGSNVAGADEMTLDTRSSKTGIAHPDQVNGLFRSWDRSALVSAWAPPPRPWIPLRYYRLMPEIRPRADVLAAGPRDAGGTRTSTGIPSRWSG